MAAAANVITKKRHRDACQALSDLLTRQQKIKRTFLLIIILRLGIFFLSSIDCLHCFVLLMFFLYKSKILIMLFESTL